MWYKALSPTSAGRVATLQRPDDGSLKGPQHQHEPDVGRVGMRRLFSQCPCKQLLGEDSEAARKLGHQARRHARNKELVDALLAVVQASSKELERQRVEYLRFDRTALVPAELTRRQ